MSRFLIAWLGALLLWAASAHAARDFVVGVLPYQGARALVVEHRALASHLEHALKRPVRIVTARNTRVFGQRLLSGEYDLALTPAHLARLAQVDAGWMPLARYLPDTPVYLLTAADHTAEPVVKGATIAVSDRAMLLSLLAEQWIATHTKLAADDYTLLETGGHSASLQALMDHRASAAVSMLAAIGQVRREHLERVRIAHELGAIPLLVFMARGDTSPPDRALLRQALLAYPVRAPLRIAPVGSSVLPAMDRYLPRTRELLAASGGAHDD